MSRFVVLSGCSGGGKSTTLAELDRRGYPIVDEPGRRIVADELSVGGRALPWVDAAAFARRCLDLALEDLESVRASTAQWVFFDRGMIDAAAALHHHSAEAGVRAAEHLHDYHRMVFLTPPWADIFVNDVERQHGFEEAVAEYDRLLVAYRALGYVVIILPRTGTQERADLILETLGLGGIG